MSSTENQPEKKLENEMDNWDRLAFYKCLFEAMFVMFGPRAIQTQIRLGSC